MSIGAELNIVFKVMLGLFCALVSNWQDGKADCAAKITVIGDEHCIFYTTWEGE